MIFGIPNGPGLPHKGCDIRAGMIKRDSLVSLQSPSPRQRAPRDPHGCPSFASAFLKGAHEGVKLNKLQVGHVQYSLSPIPPTMEQTRSASTV